MWCMNFSLWIIDVRNVVVEMRMTLIERSEDSLSDSYANSFAKQLPLYIVEDVIYSYMVCRPLCPCSLQY